MSIAVRERFLRFVHLDMMTGCWLWCGYCTPNGYGQFQINGRALGAHRVGYELLVGAIPSGLYLDHMCRVVNCVNPAHLDPVTNAENVRRSGLYERNAAKTHCLRGHEYTEANTRVYRGKRSCKTCRRELNRGYKARDRATRQKAR